MGEIAPEELAAALRSLSSWAEQQAPVPESAVQRSLREHFATEPSGLPVVSAPLAGYERVNFQIALDEVLDAAGRSAELLGLAAMGGYRMGLAELSRGGRYVPAPELGAPEYETVTVDDREVLCVMAGLWLVREGDERLAVMLRREDRGPNQAVLAIEVMAPSRDAAEGFLATLRALMDERNVYRGKVVVLTASRFGGLDLAVRRLPSVPRDGIVLPDGVLARIERHTRAFAEHADALRAAGRHVKRGLLLHGPPGTGKTLTAMYLSTLMPGRTVLILTGQALMAIGPACEIARRLQPSTLILEDVDLVALERGHYGANAVLFELLNEMDGLNEDADTLFVLTTNRAEAVEPALAARPGRIDLAVEFPLPDAEARSRLLDLYSEGLDVHLTARQRIIDQTQGVSPAFIRELLRRAALLSAEAGQGRRVTDTELSSALTELTESGGDLTRSLLGGTTAPLA